MSLNIKTKLRRRVYPFEVLTSTFLIISTLRDLFIVQQIGHDKIESSITDFNNIQTFLIGIFLFYLKIVQEGTRINVIISFFAHCSLALLKFQQYHNRLTIILHVILLLGYFAMIYFFPVYVLPEPQGQFGVGIKQMKISGKDCISVFYPAIKQPKPKIIYSRWSATPNYWRQMFESMKFGEFLPPKKFFFLATSYLEKLLISCFPNEKLASPIHEKYPVVFFSHGLAAHRQAYSVFLSDLASKGYVVFSHEHEEVVCPQSVLDAIKAKDKNRLRQIRGGQLYERQQSMNNLLKIIENKEYMERLFESSQVKLDLDNIVIMGHSFGGVNAVQTAYENPRFKAIIALDPWLFPHKENLLKLEYSNPVLIINTETFAQRNPTYELRERSEEIFESTKRKNENKLIGMYKGTDHMSQGDICFFIPKESEILGMVRSNHNLLELTQAHRFLISQFLEHLVFSKPKTQQANLEAKKQILKELDEFTQAHFGKQSQFSLMFE